MNALITVAEPTRRYLEKRDRIVAAASAIINAKGARGTTLAEVGASVGLNTASVTYYFRKKEDLAAACYQRSIDAIDALSAQAAEQPTAAKRVEALVALYIDLRDRIRSGEVAPLASFNDIRSLPSPAGEPVFAAYSDMVRKVRDLFDAPECAALPRRDRTARAHLLLETLFWSGTWIRLYDREDYPRVTARMADVLTGGIATATTGYAPKPLAPPAPEVAEPSREAFLIAATRTINEHGYSGASVEKISAELNVTKGSFYHHNEAKDELVVACFARTFRIVRGVQHRAIAAPGTWFERVAAAVHALVLFQFSEAGPLLRTSALQSLPASMRADMIEETARLARRFAAMIADGIADGSCRAVDPLIAAQLLMAMVYSAVRLPRWVPGISADEGSASYAQPALSGLLVTAPNIFDLSSRAAD